MNSLTYSFSNNSTITNISIPVETSNLTLVFFKASRYASPGAVGNKHHQLYIF